MNWTDGVYLDGPRTADWLEDWICRRMDIEVGNRTDGFHSIHKGDAISRTIYRWRYEGATPTVWGLDRYLTLFGGHIREIPEDLWLEITHIERPRQPGPRRTAEQKREMLSRTEGLTAREAGELLGVSHRSIRNWRKEAA